MPRYPWGGVGVAMMRAYPTSCLARFSAVSEHHRRSTNPNAGGTNANQKHSSVYVGQRTMRREQPTCRSVTKGFATARKRRPVPAASSRDRLVGPQGLEPWTDGLKEHEDPEE